MLKTKNLNEQLVFILEKQSSVLESRKNESNDYILEGTAAVFGKENNNNRIYEENEYLPHLNYLNEKISQRRLVGELDHPEKFDVSLKNISHIVEKLDYDKEGREIRIKVRLLDTPMGQIAKNLVDAGVPLSISSRAAGSVGNDKKVQIKKIFTYDLVADPGFQDAQLERVYESAGYAISDFFEFRNRSITNDLSCMNESLGLKNDSDLKIYKVDNNEEFNKLVSIKTEIKNKETLMENNEFVTAEELNQYSVFIKKEMEAMNSKIAEIKEQKQILTESTSDGNSDLEERVAKLEKYSEYLAENLENAIKYGEYLAENLDDSISYSKYLAENLDRNISYSKYLAENVDKSISYTEYVAESTDKNIEYSKYLAGKLDESIQYSDYLAENLDKGISYSEYLGENLDKGIAYSEYLAEKLNNGIEYSEYLAENLNKSIKYSDYLAENVNKGLDYSDYLSEKLKKSISYSEYIAETVSTSKFANLEPVNESVRAQAENISRSELKESGFAGDYSDLSSKIESLVESVKTQKTETNIKDASEFLGARANTRKAQEEVLNESENSIKTGLKFIDEIPEEYSKVWESLNEGHKQSIIAQSNFYRLDTPYQIKNFWSTRQLGSATIGVQKLDENESTIASNQSGYSSEYMKSIAEALDKKFKK
jgi:hypothetical protein